MAGVLDALAPHVMKMIKAMGESEIRMLLGVSDDIKNLEANVARLQNVVTDAERRRINDNGVQEWVSKLKDALYEADDILDLCQIEAMDRQEEQQSSSSWLCALEGLLREKLWSVGCLRITLQPFFFCVENPGFAHEVGGRIRKLNQKLDNIREDVDHFNFFNINLRSYEEYGRPLTIPEDLRGEDPLFIESDLVGDQIKEKTEELVQELITGHSCSSSSNVKIVGLVGLGGIGKSTLAKKVFASEAIDKEFKPKIWLSVTQQFTKNEPKKWLIDAITQAGKKHDEIKDETETSLRMVLTEALSKRKFLLVLDDVWSYEVWENVLRYPFLKACQPGSRVLITSRKKEVVKRMGAWSIKQVEKLGDEDAWCLLKKQLPQPQVGVDSDFEELSTIGKKIVKKCDGLPLGIKVMGGLLRTREPNEHEWNDVLEKDIGWNEDGSQKELNYSVRLSYEDLSPELKQCFLYYSLFPKGSGFIEDRVISMWISDGLVKEDGRWGLDELSLEEIGAKYHRELFARNLLEWDHSTENVWDYTLHDVIRSVAQFMAKEEAFVLHKDKANIKNALPKNKKFHRVSIFSSKLELTILENQATLRTLLIHCNIKRGGSLANFSSLRVLDIRSEKSDWLVDSLCELRHLRYLSFSNTDISRLPSDIHKMRFLQHIELEDCTELDKLPDSITKLACLRYLSLRRSNIDDIPRGFGALTNLTFLYGFPVKMDGDWCTLEELEALSNLRSLMVRSLKNVSGSSVAKRANISNKENLEYLDLNCYTEGEQEEEEEDGDDNDHQVEEDGQMEGEKIEKENEDENEIEVDEAGEEVRQIELEQQEKIEAVFDELCPPPKLKTLLISGYFGRRLPNWLQCLPKIPFTRLLSIDLLDIMYCTRLPDGLCRIRSLQDLLITQAPAIEHIGPEFQSLARAERGVAFPKLKKLELIGLSRWKEWHWEEEEQRNIIAMPNLEHLELTDCKLRRLPPGLASNHRCNLQIIFLEKLTLLEYVENFPSVVRLRAHKCSELKRISGLSKLRMVCIKDCQKLKLLERVPMLERMDLDDEPWDVTGPDASCRPKIQNQLTTPVVNELLQNLVITR